MKKLFAVMMALCLALSLSAALADQTLEGDANVDQRNYPSTAPFIHPPFYNVKLAVTVDDSGVITAVTDNGTGAAGSVADYLQNIQHVEILAEGAEKATEQEIVGHHGTLSSFIVLDENGVMNTDGIVKARDGSESPLFEAGKQYTVTVAAFGYPELVFPVP